MTRRTCTGARNGGTSARRGRAKKHDRAAAVAPPCIHQKRSGGDGTGPRSHLSKDGSAGAPRGEEGTGAAAGHEAGGTAAARWLLLPGGAAVGARVWEWCVHRGGGVITGMCSVII